MSRPVAAVVALCLLLPVLMFVAAGKAAGLNGGIYLSAIGFLAGVCFLGAAAVELRRLVEASDEDLVHGWMPKPQAAPATAARTETRAPADRTVVEVLREVPQRAKEAVVAPLHGAKAA
ncbi:MAG TPA: hypothetical protein VGU45_06265 [Microvirga sp.]|jgi:hypothetical protein|nr:hypothetical protein [Microvirga sp.]